MIKPPKLLSYSTPNEYLEHYKKNYMREKIVSHDGIRVYFSEPKFWHTCETRDKNGKKCMFSHERASYLDWIKYTIESPNAELYKGYYPDKKKVEENRRVSIIADKYKVVLQLSLSKNEELKGNFITAFPIKGNIDKAKQSPKWNRKDCIDFLKRNRG